MIRQTYHLEIITPCFCAGANPAKAEIRAPSIRGQLRWWFRVLGGFRSLAPSSVREQEALIFGSVAENDRAAGKLQVRVIAEEGKALGASTNHTVPNMQSPEGYLLFPLRNNPRSKSSLCGFTMQFVWRGSEKMDGNLMALATVLANLGSIGFRSRRAMGALASKSLGMNLTEALERFSSPAESLRVRRIPTTIRDQSHCISLLAEWLRGWRQHGRSSDLQPGNGEKRPPENDGFKWAKRDHDIGYDLASVKNLPAYRPALGLPIIQRAGGKANNWEWSWKKKAEGRFASPVILRPHRDAKGEWHALILFIDALAWPEGKQVFLNGHARNVSLELYDEMSRDPKLQALP